MSLFSLEEICLIRSGSCIYAHTHTCKRCYGSEPHLCHCEIHVEGSASSTTGKCKYKIVREEGS